MIVETVECRSVYFIQAVNGGPIKIGVTSSVRKRLGELQTGNPNTLRLLLVLPESVFTEAELHEMFNELRIPGGEWFHPGDDLVSFLDEQVLRVSGAASTQSRFSESRAAKLARRQAELEESRAFSRRYNEAQGRGLSGNAALQYAENSAPTAPAAPTALVSSAPVPPREKP